MTVPPAAKVKTDKQNDTKLEKCLLSEDSTMKMQLVKQETI